MPTELCNAAQITNRRIVGFIDAEYSLYEEEQHEQPNQHQRRRQNEHCLQLVLWPDAELQRRSYERRRWKASIWVTTVDFIRKRNFCERYETVKNKETITVCNNAERSVCNNTDYVLFFLY